MKINNRSASRSKKIFIIAGILSLVIVGSVAYAYSAKLGPFQKDDSDTSTATAQRKAGYSTKQTSLGASADSANDVATGSDPSPAPIKDPAGGKSTVSAEITAANQSSSTLQVRTLIQTVTDTGTCSIALKGPGGKTYSADAGIQALPSSSTCKGFDIPVSSLAPGAWSITVTFENDSLTATASKDITIQ